MRMRCAPNGVFTGPWTTPTLSPKTTWKSTEGRAKKATKRNEKKRLKEWLSSGRKEESCGVVELWSSYGVGGAKEMSIMMEKFQFYRWMNLPCRRQEPFDLAWTSPKHLLYSPTHNKGESRLKYNDISNSIACYWHTDGHDEYCAAASLNADFKSLDAFNRSLSPRSVVDAPLPFTSMWEAVACFFGPKKSNKPMFNGFLAEVLASLE